MGTVNTCDCCSVIMDRTPPRCTIPKVTVSCAGLQPLLNLPGAIAWLLERGYNGPRETVVCVR